MEVFQSEITKAKALANNQMLETSNVLQLATSVRREGTQKISDAVFAKITDWSVEARLYVARLCDFEIQFEVFFIESREKLAAVQRAFTSPQVTELDKLIGNVSHDRIRGSSMVLSSFQDLTSSHIHVVRPYINQLYIARGIPLGQDREAPDVLIETVMTQIFKD